MIQMNKNSIEPLLENHSDGNKTLVFCGGTKIGKSQVAQMYIEALAKSFEILEVKQRAAIDHFNLFAISLATQDTVNLVINRSFDIDIKPWTIYDEMSRFDFYNKPKYKPSKLIINLIKRI